MYTLTEMLSDLRHGVWTEIYGTAPVKIDVYRRGVQRAYLTDVGNKINPPAAPRGGRRSWWRRRGSWRRGPAGEHR